MFRVLCMSAAAVVGGLHISPEPTLPVESSNLLAPHLGGESGLGSGVVKAATSAGKDPEFHNTLNEKFNVALEGVVNLITMPRGANIMTCAGAEFVANASIEDIGLTDCDDLLIRKVNLCGSKLAPVSSLEFDIVNETFNSTDALGLKIDGVSKTLTEFLAEMPTCTFYRPRVVALPTGNSYRHRTAMYTAICNFGTNTALSVMNTVTVTWSHVWRKKNGEVYYQNDLEVYISGVGTDPGGLLGPDDHSWVQQTHSYCATRNTTSR